MFQLVRIPGANESLQCIDPHELMVINEIVVGAELPARHESICVAPAPVRI